MCIFACIKDSLKGYWSLPIQGNCRLWQAGTRLGLEFLARARVLAVGLGGYSDLKPVTEKGSEQTHI